MSELRVSLGTLISPLPDPTSAKDVSNLTQNQGQTAFEQLLSKENEHKSGNSKEKKQAGNDVKLSASSNVSRQTSRKRRVGKGAALRNEGTVPKLPSGSEYATASSISALNSYAVDASRSVSHINMIKDHSNFATHPAAVNHVHGADGAFLYGAEPVSGYGAQTDLQLSKADVGEAGQNPSSRSATSNASRELENIVLTNESAKVQVGYGHVQNSSSKVTTSEVSKQNTNLRQSNDGEISKLVAPGWQSLVKQTDQVQNFLKQQHMVTQTATAVATANSDQLANSQDRQSGLLAKPHGSNQVLNVDNISHSEFVVPLIHQSVTSSNIDSNNPAPIDLNSLAASISRPLAAGDGNYSLSITLHPVDLGHIDAVVTLDKGTLNVSIIAQNQTTHHAISNSLQELKQTLQSGGLNVNVTLRDHGMGSKENSHHQGIGSSQITPTSEVLEGTVQEPTTLSRGQIHIVL